MRGLISLLVVAAISYGVYQYYVTPHGRSESPGSMMQAISSTGVKNDLIAIAEAERGYLADHGSYGSFDDLVSSGSLASTHRAREGYKYSVAITSGGFLATARYTGPANPPAPSFTVDQGMQIQAVQ